MSSGFVHSNTSSSDVAVASGARVGHASPPCAATAASQAPELDATLTGEQVLEDGAEGAESRASPHYLLQGCPTSYATGFAFSGANAAASVAPASVELVASTATTTEASGRPPSGLTEEQRRRIEEKRAAALARRDGGGHGKGGRGVACVDGSAHAAAAPAIVTPPMPALK